MLRIIVGNMGFMGWPMLFALLVAVILTVWCASQLMGKRAVPGLRTKAWVDAIIFWGGFAGVSGALGGLVGIIIAIQRIEAAGEVTGPLVAYGFRVALIRPSVGLLILLLSGLAWFPLQLRWRLLMAGSSSEGLA
jgi:hypothetical protein